MTYNDAGLGCDRLNHQACAATVAGERTIKVAVGNHNAIDGAHATVVDASSHKQVRCFGVGDRAANQRPSQTTSGVSKCHRYSLLLPPSTENFLVKDREQKLIQAGLAGRCEAYGNRGRCCCWWHGYSSRRECHGWCVGDGLEYVVSIVQVLGQKVTGLVSLLVTLEATESATGTEKGFVAVTKHEIHSL